MIMQNLQNELISFIVIALVVILLLIMNLKYETNKNVQNLFL